MCCGSAFKDYISQFPDTVKVNAKLDPNTDYWWEIKDHFDNTYVVAFATDADGYGSIDPSGLPAGFLNASISCITIRVKTSEAGCDYVQMPIVSKYDEVNVQVRNINTAKTNIGCPVVPVNVVTLSAYFGWKDTADALDDSGITAGTAQSFTSGADITIDFVANTADKYLWFAYPATEAAITSYYIGPLDNGTLGSGGTFALPITVGSYSFVISNYPTQIPTPVTFSR